MARTPSPSDQSAQKAARKPLPLSVFIIAHNEADRIGRTLASVADWVDEVIVVINSDNQDNTAEIAKQHGAQVFHKDWEGYGAQKRYGEAQCRNDWLFNLDADEVVTPALRDSITALFAQNNFQYAAYRMRWILMSPNPKRRFSRFGPGGDFVRLYNRHKAEFRDSTTHDSVILKEPHTTSRQIGKLKGVVLHYSFRSYAHEMDKINHYTTMQAEEMFSRGRRVSVARIIAEPFATFFKCYILRRFFMWGIEGFMEAIIHSTRRTLRFAKLYEKYNKER